MDAPLTAVFCADLEPAHALPRVKAEAVARGKDPKQVEDLELAVGYYATHGKLASLVKGVAANALSPVAPAPQPEGRKAWAYKSAMLAAQTYLLAATAHGLALLELERDSRREGHRQAGHREPRCGFCGRASAAHDASHDASALGTSALGRARWSLVEQARPRLRSVRDG